MNHENDIQVNGDITYKYGLFSTPNLHEKDGSNNIDDITVDFSVNTTHIVDLRGATYIGTSGNINLIMSGGDVSNVKNQLIILQNATDPLHEDLHVSLISSATIDGVAALEALINVFGSVNSFTFDYIQATGLSPIWRLASGTGGAGYVEDNQYTSEAIIAINDTYQVALSKLDSLVGKLIPELPPYINDGSITLSLDQSTVSLHKLSDGVTVSVVTSAEPTLSLSAAVYTDGGFVRSYIDGTVDGAIDLASSDTVNNSLSITKSTDPSGFYDLVRPAVNTLNKNGGQLTDIETQHTVYTETEDATARQSNSVLFYKVRSVSWPALANPSSTSIQVPGGISRKVSGLSALDNGDIIETQAIYNNVTFNVGDNTGFYPDVVGNVSGAAVTAQNVNASTFAEMIANTPNTPNTVKNVTVNSSAYGSMSITFKSVSPRGVSAGFVVNTEPGGKMLLLDAVTDTVSASPYVFDHSLNLTGTATLMLLNGRFVYPFGDWSAYLDGLNYSAITGWRELLSGNISTGGFSRIRTTLPAPANFVGAIEGSDYQMLVTRSDKPGEVFDGNSAYDGLGTVQNGEGCLDAAASSASEKVITFGEVVGPGVTATIKILLNTGSTKTFGQAISYVAF